MAGAAINTLTGGPIFSLNTPVSAYVTATQSFETDLGVVANTLSSTATTPLTLTDVSTTIQAEAEAYRASMDAGLQVTHPGLSSTVNAAVTTLEDTVETIASANSSTAQADIHTAIAAFDSAILDTTGLFGLNGPVNRVNSELGYVPHNLTAKPTATTIDNVSGTATFGGPATLTATLNSATGTGLVGKVVSFTLDGAFAGTAVTDSSGVATLTGVPQSDTAGTDTGGIVASFAGDSTNKLSQNSGDLVVSQAATSLSTVSGTASFGGTATLMATLTSSDHQLADRRRDGRFHPRRHVRGLGRDRQHRRGHTQQCRHDRCRGHAHRSRCRQLRRQHQLSPRRERDGQPGGQPGQHDDHPCLKCQPQRIRSVGDVHGDRRRRLAGLGHADGYGHFLDGTTTIGTGTLTAGVATFSTSTPLRSARTRSPRSTPATRTSPPVPRVPFPRL